MALAKRVVGGVIAFGFILSGCDTPPPASAGRG